MTDQSSEDWLPPGWTVEVKVRNCGKKDKYYYAPSNGPKFNSRTEVARYLSQMGHHETEQRNKGTLKQSENNVVYGVVEKVVAAGLPPGWIKEIRVTGRDLKKRRDLYYIDPVSEKAFRSMKDAFCYLESVELERQREKSKYGSDKESEDSKTSIQNFAVSCTKEQNGFDQNSCSSEMALKDEQVIFSSCAEGCLPVSKHASDRCTVTESNNSDPKATETLEQKGEPGFCQSEFISDPAVEIPSHEQSPEGDFIPIGRRLSQPHLSKSKKKRVSNLPRRVSKRLAGLEADPLPEASLVVLPGREGTQPDLSKSKEKKEPDLPRRASKRLAGLDVDPVPELKTRTRAHQVAEIRFGNGVAHAGDVMPPTYSAQCRSQLPDIVESELKAVVCSISTSKNMELPLKSCKLGKLVTADAGKHVKDVGRVNDSDDKQKGNVFSMEIKVPQSEHGGDVQTNDKVEEKPGSIPDLPLGELLMDPCIAFAIKTLTGMPLDASESSEMFPESKSGEPSSQITPTPKESGGKVGTEDKVLKKQGCSTHLPSASHSFPEKVREIESDNKSGSPVEQPFIGSWLDPCIEFAIKTLTGAIPLDYDTCIGEYCEQKLSTSKKPRK